MNIHIKEIIQSKTFVGILYGIGVCIIVLAVFELGVLVGFQKAKFSYRVNDSYSRLFNERNSPAQTRMPVNFGDAHGTAGIIQHIQDTYVLVVDQNNMEKTIVINEHTIIKKERETISSKDLREGDAIVVIGDPNDQAFIDAKLVRVIPPADSRDVLPRKNIPIFDPRN